MRTSPSHLIRVLLNKLEGRLELWQAEFVSFDSNLPKWSCSIEKLSKIELIDVTYGVMPLPHFLFSGTRGGGEECMVRLPVDK